MRGDDDLAFFVRRVGVYVVLRQARKLIDRIEFDGSNSVADIALKFLADSQDFLVECRDARPGFFILVNAGEFETLDQFFHRPPGVGISRAEIDGCHSFVYGP